MRTLDFDVALEEDGFVLVRGLYSAEEITALSAALSAALARDESAPALIRDEAGYITGARNVVEIWPGAADAWRHPLLTAALGLVLGPAFGLVRVLYFDKPPGRSWSLPWHQDTAVAVKDNQLPSRHFGKPTRKAGVPHVEAPAWLLWEMVAARLHLDDVTDENGPLRVIPGSHRVGKGAVGCTARPVSVHARRGDVLLMRPLVVHASSGCAPGTQRRRRILHFEFAACRELPDGYEWAQFLPL